MTGWKLDDGDEGEDDDYLRLELTSFQQRQMYRYVRNKQKVLENYVM